MSKMGMLFILDRVTGKPIYGVEERPVPKGELAGEHYSPTQPFPLKPPPLSRLSFTMDEIATAAGVGKGTLFRRFGSRAGLMIVLLDEDEQAEQQAFLFGPAPLGPSAPPLERLLAYGRARLRFVHTHHALLSDIDRDPHSRYNAPVTLHRNHIQVLLEAAGTTGHLDAQTEALLALLQADYVEHQIHERGLTLEELGDGWESLARKLCGR